MADPVMMMRPPFFMCFSAACVAASRFERFRNGCAGIVHKHIKSAEGGDGLFDRALDSFDVGSIRPDGDSLSASELDCFHHGRSRAGVLCIRDGHSRSIRS